MRATQRKREYIRVVRKNGRCPVALMHIEIYHSRTAYPAMATCPLDGDGKIVEYAESGAFAAECVPPASIPPNHTRVRIQWQEAWPRRSPECARPVPETTASRYGGARRAEAFPPETRARMPVCVFSGPTRARQERRPAAGSDYPLRARGAAGDIFPGGIYGLAIAENRNGHNRRCPARVRSPVVKSGPIPSIFTGDFVHVANQEV